MAVYIILDIETIAHPDAANWVDPVVPDARLVDPVKIEKSIKERTEERDKECALDPDLNRIIALGYFVVGQLGDPICHLMVDENEEAQALTAFGDIYRQLDRRNEVRLVTFNGLKFDMPTLLRRSMYLDVSFPELELDRYRTPHLDIWWRLSHKGLIKAHSLRFYAKRMNLLDEADPVSGGDIAQLVKDGEWGAIRQHCISDVGLTHALANRLKLLRYSVSA